MFFQTYRKLSQRDRALMDGRLITYHFYVGGATLLTLGFYGAFEQHARSWADAVFPWVAVIFGFAGLVLGLGLHFVHRAMIRGSQRDAYLATLTAVMGRHRFPLVPSLLGILVVFSIFVTVLYILASS